LELDNMATHIPEGKAYVCNDCGEAFLPESGDWPELKRIHKTECVARSFKRVSVEEAF
jgi:hypothetical protein